MTRLSVLLQHMVQTRRGVELYPVCIVVTRLSVLLQHMVQTGMASPYPTPQFPQNGEALPLKAAESGGGGGQMKSGEGGGVGQPVPAYSPPVSQAVAVNAAVNAVNGIEQQNVSIVSTPRPDTPRPTPPRWAPRLLPPPAPAREMGGFYDRVSANSHRLKWEKKKIFATLLIIVNIF